MRETIAETGTTETQNEQSLRYAWYVAIVLMLGGGMVFCAVYFAGR